MGIKHEEPTPESRAFVIEIMKEPKLKEIDERLRKIEDMLFGAKKWPNSVSHIIASIKITPKQKNDLVDSVILL